MSNNFNFNNQSGIKITINNDKYFYIYPNDLNFTEKFADSYQDVKKIMDKFEKKAMGMKDEFDEDGIPKNLKEKIKLQKDVYDEVYKVLDNVLGEGVSDMVFEGRYDDELLENFLEYVQKVILDNRKTSMDKHLNRAQRRKKGNTL